MKSFDHFQIFLPLAQKVRDAGGRFLFVGGAVRDLFLNLETKDFDAEVFGLEEADLLKILSHFGKVEMVGKAFSVYKLQSLHLDVSLPRRDTKQSVGHRGFSVEVDPFISFPEAASRRDLTINSIGYDPLTGEFFDPFEGQKDIQNKVLRPTDPLRFGEDPLRAMRAAVFAARFEMTASPSLCDVMAHQDLSELPGERLKEEFSKLLTQSQRPSLGFKLLDEVGLLRFFPEIKALQGVPQNTYWHPEGDVWTHTMMVIDYAAQHPLQGGDSFMLMLAALCHDFGKPLTTTIEPSGAIRAKGHEEKGVPPTGDFLARLRVSRTLEKQIKLLVKHHLKPVQYAPSETPRENFLFLSRDLKKEGLSLQELAWLARADGMGRATSFAKEGICPDVDAFLTRVEALDADNPAVIADILTGEDLLTKGYAPGPHLGDLLDKARLFQYREGISTKEALIEALFKNKETS